MRVKNTLSSNAGKQCAFTLVEIMIVIAVITIVSAMLMPVFAEARGKARQMVCLSNSRQIGMAAALYMQDSDGSLPLNRHSGALAGWLESLQPFLRHRGIFRCPSDASTIPWASSDADYKSATDKRLTSYYTNAWLTGMAGYGTDVRVERPASVIYVAESADNVRGDHFHRMCWGQTDPQMPACARADFAWDGIKGETREIALRRHNDGSNYIYLDGHAKWRRWEQVYWWDAGRGIYSGDFDPRQ